RPVGWHSHTAPSEEIGVAGPLAAPRCSLPSNRQGPVDLRYQRMPGRPFVLLGAVPAKWLGIQPATKRPRRTVWFSSDCTCDFHPLDVYASIVVHCLCPLLPLGHLPDNAPMFPPDTLAKLVLKPALRSPPVEV